MCLYPSRFPSKVLGGLSGSQLLGTYLSCRRTRIESVHDSIFLTESRYPEMRHKIYTSLIMSGHYFMNIFEASRTGHSWLPTLLWISRSPLPYACALAIHVPECSAGELDHHRCRSDGSSVARPRRDRESKYYRTGARAIILNKCLFTRGALRVIVEPPGIPVDHL